LFRGPAPVGGFLPPPRAAAAGQRAGGRDQGRCQEADRRLRRDAVDEISARAGGPARARLPPGEGRRGRGRLMMRRVSQQRLGVAVSLTAALAFVLLAVAAVADDRDSGGPAAA